MKNRTNQILYSYWNEVRQSRLAPRRFDIEPARIAGILAETMILERCEDSAIRFRLAGTRIAEQFGSEFRGQSFLDMWSEGDAATLQHHLNLMQSQGGVLLFEIDAVSASGREITFEAVLMPLVHTRDVVDRYLGAISAMQNPMWLGSEPLTDLTLGSFEMIWPDGRPHAIAERFLHTPALSPASAGSRLVRLDRRQFRVFDGGRSMETKS